jgi:hypothetical protein
MRTARFAENHLDQPRILLVLAGDLDGERGRGHVRQPDQAALDLRHRLLAQHHDITSLERRALGGRGGQ